jgi:phosphate transport system protein
MNINMANHLQKELDQLKAKILNIGSIVEHTLFRAIKAASELDQVAFERIHADDKKIDQLEVELEEDCLKVLALYQPVAGDLRFVVSVLKINNDLERIGDLAVNITRIGSYLAEEAPITVPFNFEEMSNLVREMLKNSLDSLVNMDGDLAHKVCKDDDNVDAIHRKMYTTVYEEIAKKPERAKALIHYLSISRHLERIADSCTNIAEDVIYMVDGIIIRHHLSDYDRLSSNKKNKP